MDPRRFCFFSSHSASGFLCLIVLCALMTLFARNSAALKCYNCENSASDCAESTCEGAVWCSLQVTQQTKTGSATVNKHCVDKNELNTTYDDCQAFYDDRAETKTTRCFCKQEDLCNKKSLYDRDINYFPEPHVPEQPSGANTNAVASEINCNECQNDNGDCITGSCVGFWCKAEMVKNDNLGVLQMRKSCTRQSPNPGADESSLCKIDDNGSGTLLIQCYCRNKDYCTARDQLAQAYLRASKSTTGQIGSSLFPISKNQTVRSESAPLDQANRLAVNKTMYSQLHQNSTPRNILPSICLLIPITIILSLL